MGPVYAKLPEYNGAGRASIGGQRKLQDMNTAKKSILADASANSATIGRNVLDYIGNTPLLRLERVGPNYPHVEFYGKAEWFNPGGSVKDRPALEMIREAERTGQLKPGQTILDATSGNTGIAYAMIAAALGYRVKLCLPASASEERKKILKAFGAELVITPGDEGSDGAILRAREIIAAEPGNYYYPNQYGNDSNWRAHYKTTANEIWEQTAGRITHFVAGLGTSGTFVGTTRRLKELNPAIRCISLQPTPPSTDSKVGSIWPQRLCPPFMTRHLPTPIWRLERKRPTAWSNGPRGMRDYS
jgi:cysteine synthase B